MPGSPLIRRIPLMVVMALTLPGLAFAHAKITATVPADGDFVSAPEELILTFDNEVQLTGVELKTVEGESRAVGDVSADRAKTYTVSVPRTLPPGEYYLIWRCIASDSHFSTGEFFFTVVAD
jgi:methionine-rich copper-binding protein CopC